MMAGSPCPIEVMRRVMSLMHLRRNHHRLRHDRDEPGQLPDRDRRPARAARLHRRHHPPACRGQGRSTPRAASSRVGTPGELCTRGYAVMLGYWEDAERTAQAIDQAGWMHTGDLATIDAEGYCAIVGRIKDMVIRGGENVYPREVEEFLYRHPEDRGRAGVRRARPEIRRGDLRLDQAARRRDHDARRTCAPSAATRSPTTRSRATSASSTNFPMTVTGKMQKYPDARSDGARPRRRDAGGGIGAPLCRRPYRGNAAARLRMRFSFRKRTRGTRELA